MNSRRTGEAFGLVYELIMKGIQGNGKISLVGVAKEQERRTASMATAGRRAAGARSRRICNGPQAVHAPNCKWRQERLLQWAAWSGHEAGLCSTRVCRRQRCGLVSWTGPPWCCCE